LEQLIHALAESPCVRKVAGPKVRTKGLIHQVSIQVDANGGWWGGGQGHGLLQAVKVEAAWQYLGGGAKIISAISVHSGGLRWYWEGGHALSEIAEWHNSLQMRECWEHGGKETK
jgi:hypothetical protein